MDLLLVVNGLPNLDVSLADLESTKASATMNTVQLSYTRGRSFKISVHLHAIHAIHTPYDHCSTNGPTRLNHLLGLTRRLPYPSSEILVYELARADLKPITHAW